MITSFNREIGIVVLMGYVAFKDLNEDINLLAYIVKELLFAICSSNINVVTIKKTPVTH